VTLLGHGTLDLVDNHGKPDSSIQTLKVGAVVDVHVDPHGKNAQIVNRHQQTLTALFTTGSAIGEATHVVAATVAAPSVSVDNGGTLNITATDDYGDPATNATVTVAGSGSFTSTSATITNGMASVPLNDHKAESVTLTYTMKDNTYSDQADDTHTGTASETFVPGAPKTITLDANQTTVQAGNPVALTGTVYDQYNNVATNDADSISVSVNNGTPVSETLSNGTFTYSLDTSDDQKEGTYAVTAADGSVTGSSSIQVTPGPVDAAKSVVKVDKASIMAGDSVNVSVTTDDVYGNPLGQGQTVTVSDGISSTPTTLQWNATNNDYEGALQETKSGTVTFSVTDDGTSLQTTPTVTVNPGAPDVDHSSVTFATLQVVVPQWYEVYGTVRDQYGNAIPNQNVSLSVDGWTGTTSTGSDGEFGFDAEPTSATSLTTATVSIDGLTLASKQTRVLPGTVDPRMSTISAPADVKSGTGNVTVSVVPKDVVGNPLGDVERYATVTVSDGTTTMPATWNAANNDYEAIFTEVNSHYVTFTATVNGVTLVNQTTVTVVDVPLLDQHTYGSVISSRLVGTTNTQVLASPAVAQNFYSGFTGKLTKVSLPLEFDPSTMGSLGSPSVAIYSVNSSSGAPGTLLATGIPDFSNFNNSGWVDFNFSTPLQVTQGTMYYIVLSDNSGDVAWEQDDGVASSQQELVYVYFGSWIKVSTYTCGYRTYVIPQ